MSDDQVMHMAPPENQVHRLMGDLLNWLAEGNERMGRVWQTLILSLWNLICLNILVESLI